MCYTFHPVDWCRAIELQRLAKRIVSLCASSSGCERCWSTFNFVSILVINNFYLDAYNLIFCFASHLIFFVCRCIQRKGIGCCTRDWMILFLFHTIGRWEQGFSLYVRRQVKIWPFGNWGVWLGQWIGWFIACAHFGCSRVWCCQRPHMAACWWSHRCITSAVGL